MRHCRMGWRAAAIAAAGVFVVRAVPVSAAPSVVMTGYELPAGFSSLEVGRKAVVEADDRTRRRRTLTGTFEVGGEVITFQTIRGGRPRLGSVVDEEGPRYEIDVCFKDGDGRPFIVQSGGDKVLDPTCDPDLLEEEPEASGDEVQASSLTPEQRQAHFAMAEAMIQALRSIEFRRPFLPEYQALVGHAALAAEGQAALDLDCSDDDVVCEAGTQSEGDIEIESHQNRWEHIFRVFYGVVSRKWRELVGIDFATHGATLALRRDFRNGLIYLAYHRCNHGRCYYDSGMNHRCTFLSGPNRQYHVHNLSCQTLYNPWSGARGYRGHNSNDDTALQYRSVRLDQHPPRFYGSGFPCDDLYRHDTTDPCY